MNQKKRVRSLLRVSSKQQLHDDDIPIQRAEIANYISKQPDWEFDKEYIEKAISAFKNTVQEREVLLQILEDAKAKQFDVLLTFMSDRIGRLEEYSMYIATLNKLGIEVWTIKEGLLSTEEDTDRLTLFIKFWSNERESRKTGQRVKAAQCEMVKQGKHVGGKAPYGYELVYSGEISNHGRALKKLQIVEDEAAIVREIFRLSAEENLGSFAIAKHLNKQGILGINGKEWKSCTISDRLKNPIYMGYLTYNRRTHKDTYQKNPQEDWIYSEEQQQDLVIVSAEVWYKSQRNREKRKATISSVKEDYGITTTGKLPLMGLAYCGYCGTRLTNGSRYDTWTLKDGTKVKKVCGRYKCTQKANASLQCEGSALYRADEIEPIIFTEVNKYMNKLKQSNVYTDILKNQEKSRKAILKEVESIQKEIQSIDSDIKALEDNIPQALTGKGLFSAERLSTLLQEKESQKKEIQSRLDQKQQEYNSTSLTHKDINKFSRIIPNWEQEFTSSPIHIKKVLLGKIIERIDIYKDEIRIVFKISEEAFRSEGLSEESHAIPEESQEEKGENQGENLPIKGGSHHTILYKLCSG